jgi:hydroxymethylglutaryl-CoA lyase
MPTIFKKADIKLIECPRDAMQGLERFIPTTEKVEYLKLLLNVGFHTLDCGSFVSSRVIPQMKDSNEVLDAILPLKNGTNLSVIVANYRGAEDATAHRAVDVLGYPFSVSETFQRRNTNKGLQESLDLVRDIFSLSEKMNKKMVVYISMGFGNPYGEEWSPEIVLHWVQKLKEIGIRSLSVSDTVGVSNPKNISAVFQKLLQSVDDVEFGAHFHTRPESWKEKIDAAFENGCTRFDGAIAGYGGCPMADDVLVGNMPTEHLIQYFGSENLKIDMPAFTNAAAFAKSLLA